MSRIALFSLLVVTTAAQAGPAAELRMAFLNWINQPVADRPAIGEQTFAKAALTERQAIKIHEYLWTDHVANTMQERATEMAKKAITIGEHTLRFESKTFGAKPGGGHSLYISMHGGGNTRAKVNDQQWKNQISLYKPQEGIYLAPRAPSDTWNLWHRSHIDPLFDRLIENLVLLDDVDPNKVYFMGYSAGGDGVYQLAPRMADRLAAAAMMAGHPNETTPDGLRNIGFTLHMGAEDGAYKRNQIAAEWKTRLNELHREDPGGYVHEVKIHKGKGHWMEREDAVAVPWMAKFTRDPHPNKVVWLQDDVTHTRFYWLSLAQGDVKNGQRIVASIKGQTITIEEARDCPRLTLLLTDALVDLDQEVKVTYKGKTLFQGKVRRTIADLATRLSERLDPKQLYWAGLPVDLGA